MVMNLPWTKQSTAACVERSGSQCHIRVGSMYAANGALKPRMLAVRMPKSAAPRRQSMTVMRSSPGTGPMASAAILSTTAGSVGFRAAKEKRSSTATRTAAIDAASFGAEQIEQARVVFRKRLALGGVNSEHRDHVAVVDERHCQCREKRRLQGRGAQAEVERRFGVERRRGDVRPPSRRSHRPETFRGRG